MIGRGALANPRLPGQIAAELGICPLHEEALGEKVWNELLRELVQIAGESGRTLSRLKQWLSLAQRHGDFRHFDAVKRVTSIGELFATLEGAGAT